MKKDRFVFCYSLSEIAWVLLLYFALLRSSSTSLEVRPV